MAIAWVQDDQAASASASSLAVTFGSNTTSGNMIIAVMSTSNTMGIMNVTDTNNNVYNKVIRRAQGSAAPNLEIWIAFNITGGVTPTVTSFNNLSQTYLMSITEVTGVDTVAPLDLVYAAPQVTPLNQIWTIGPTMLPRTDNEFVFVAAVTNSSGLAWSLGTGFTNLQTQSQASVGTMGTQSKVISSRAAQTPQFNMNGSVSGVIMCLTFADVPLAQTELPTQVNGYQFFKSGDGLSVTEKIR